jgi:hypothetical protein
VSVFGTLDLWHMSAVELEMTRARKSVSDVARERDRYELVAATPDEQRIRLQCAQPRPEAVPPVRFL